MTSSDKPASAPAPRRRLPLLLGAILAAVVALLLIVPAFLDWNEYKPQIRQAVLDATGRELVIGGDIGLRLLPSPALTLSDVRLSNFEDGTTPDMVRVSAFDVRLAFWPLFTGTVAVSSIVLEDPVIVLERRADGTANWELTPARATAPAEGGVDGVAADDEGGTDVPLGVSVSRARIENGRLVYIDQAAGTRTEVSDMDLDLEADSLSGPFDLEASAALDGMPLTLEARVGKVASRRAVPFRLALGTGGGEGALTLAGQLSEPTPEGKLSGSLTLSADRLADLRALTLPAGRHDVPGLLAHGLSLESPIEGTLRNVSLTDLKLALGPARFTGRMDAAFADAPRLDLRLFSPGFDAEPLIGKAPIAVRGRVAPAEDAPPSGARSDRQAGPAGGQQAARGGFAVPTGMAGSIEVTVDEIDYGRGAMRDARAVAQLADGRLEIADLSVSLPGQSSFALNGEVFPLEGEPGFKGGLAFDSADLRGLLFWAGVDLAGLPPEALRKFDFRSDIQARAARVEIQDIKVRLDETRAVGAVVAALGPRIGLGVSVRAGTVDLDKYLAAPAAERSESASPTPAPTPGGAGASKPAPDPLAALAVLGDFDLNFRGSVESLIYRKAPAQDIALDLSLVQGRLDIRKLAVADLLGARADLALRIDELTSAATMEARYNVTVPKLEALAGTLDLPVPDVARRMGTVSLDGTAAGKLSDIALDGTAGAAGGQVTYQGRIAQLTAQPSLDLSLGVSHANVARLIRVFDPLYEPAGGNLGPIELSGRLKADSIAASLSDLTGRIGPVALNGQVEAELTGARPAVIARLALSEVPVDMFVPTRREARLATNQRADASGGAELAQAAPAGPPWSTAPIDLSAMGLVDADVQINAAEIKYGAFRLSKPSLVMTLKDSVADISRLGGGLFGGDLSLTGQVNGRATPRINTALNVQKADLGQAVDLVRHLGLGGGLLGLDFGLSAEGGSQAALVQSLSGNGAASLTNGSLIGIDIDAITKRLENLDTPEAFLGLFQTALSGGTTPFRDLSGNFRISNGVVQTRDLTVKSRQADLKLAGNVDLARFTMDTALAISLASKPDVPPFGLRLVGPLTAPERVLDVQAIQAHYLKKGVGKFLEKVLPKNGGGEQGSPGSGGTGALPTPGGLLDKLLRK